MKRSLYFAVYFTAAAVQAWPAFMLWMALSFGSHDPIVILSLLMLLLCIILLLAAAGTLLINRYATRTLVITGPALAMFLSAIMAFTVFHHSVGVLSLTVPQAIASALALVVGIAASLNPPVEGVTPWPQ
jgi:hypothetical protein